MFVMNSVLLCFFICMQTCQMECKHTAVWCESNESDWQFSHPDFCFWQCEEFLKSELSAETCNKYKVTCVYFSITWNDFTWHPQLKWSMRVVLLLLVSSGCVGAALHLLGSKCHHGAIMPSRQQPPEILKTPAFRLLERKSWLKHLELLLISLCRSAAWGNTL